MQAAAQKSRWSEKEKKDVSLRLPPEAKSAIQQLHNLDKPVEKQITQIVNYARDVLDGKEGCDGYIQELLTLEQEWKAGHAEKLKKMTSLLERCGAIPMGSVEATAGQKRASPSD